MGKLKTERETEAQRREMGKWQVKDEGRGVASMNKMMNLGGSNNRRLNRKR